MKSRFTIPKLRWVIAGLLLVVTLINYTDRMTLSVLIGEVSKDLDLGTADYGRIVSAFFLAYAIMYAVSGYVVDRLGTKVGMAVFVFTWSVAQLLHGLATGKWTLAACRFGLGLAEPGSFPAATRAVREWFSPEQRALGVGIFNAGSSLGAAIASPVAAFLALRYGWRAAFIFTGALGLVWLVFWWVLYQPPQDNRWLSEAEARELRAKGVAAAPPPTAQPPTHWFAVLRSRPCLALILARFFTDPVIYFVIAWFPAYLQKERGFDLAMIGKYAWVPFIFGDVGYIFGGWFSGWLMRRGRSLRNSRKLAMMVGAAVMPVGALTPFVPSASLAIAATCVVVFGHAVWVANLLTLPADLFRHNEVGTATGFSGMGGAIAGALANFVTGTIVTHFTFLPIFIWAGVMHPLSLILLWRLLPDRVFATADNPAPARS